MCNLVQQKDHCQKTQNDKLYITVLTASYDKSQKQKSTFFHQTTALQKYYSNAQPGITDHMWVMVIEQLLHYSPDCTLQQCTTGYDRPGRERFALSLNKWSIEKCRRVSVQHLVQLVMTPQEGKKCSFIEQVVYIKVQKSIVQPVMMYPRVKL